jgi:hypothetical protein
MNEHDRLRLRVHDSHWKYLLGSVYQRLNARNLVTHAIQLLVTYHWSLMLRSHVYDVWVWWVELHGYGDDGSRK